MPGTPDGSSAGHDAAIVEGGTRARDAATDTGTVGPTTYPRLKIADIGKVVAVGTDFLFTEGPIWDPAQDALFFTDINADVIYRLTLPDTLEVAVKNMGHADGLALDPEGNLIGAGYVSRDIWRLDGSKIRPITDSYRARKYNSPDELAARSDGVIYFTDPTFGINGSQGFTAQTAELCFQGVYRIMPSGAVYLEDQTTAGPNGVILSPDEQIVYVSYTNTGEVHAFDVAADGSLHNKRLFASGVSVADSSCVDAAGNLYVAALNGIVVLDPTGAQVGVIPTPGQVPTNCAFGGPDQRTFFITARIALVGVPMAGNSALFKIEDMPIPGIPGRP
jgi:gluconolactonase